MDINKIALLFILCLLATPAFGQITSDKLSETAELFVSSYNEKNFKKLFLKFDSKMQKIVPLENLGNFLNQIHKSNGKIVKINPPRYASKMAATFLLEFEKGKLDLILSLNSEGKINEMRLSPAKPRVNLRNKTKLKLPFIGEWLVFWGGDEVTQNYHQDFLNQRFAFDILKVDSAGKTHKGSGKKNQDYYAFGEKIVSPANGIVTDVINGVRDNVPGVLNPMVPLGNTVMIRHENGEVSVFAHFKLNSIQVKVGDEVKTGQLIGLCGNSGNSSEAHLHYQLQKTNYFENEGSIKVFFEKLYVKHNSKREIKENYSPIKGDIVSSK